MGKKTFIALLVLFGALYLGAVTFGFVTLESPGEQKKAREDMSAGDKPFVRILDKPMSLFAPRLLLEGLKCNGQPVDKTLRLTESASSCTLTLRVGKDQEFRRGELKTYGPGITTWWAVQAANGERPEGCKDPEAVLRTPALRLIVGYAPKEDKNKQGETCWLKQDSDRPSNVTVTGKGGTLSLMCSGCDERNNKAIRLRIE